MENNNSHNNKMNQPLFIDITPEEQEALFEGILSGFDDDGYDRDGFDDDQYFESVRREIKRDISVEEDIPDEEDILDEEDIPDEEDISDEEDKFDDEVFYDPGSILTILLTRG